MNYDEFAFFNQQLAAMLRDGIPLEGALKQLCAGMKVGSLRNELSALEDDLARGVPLDQAITRHALPEFYVRMVAIGARNNDLPGMLTLLADYYQRASTTWNRLKGLMVYPFLVLLVSLGLTLVLSSVARRFLEVVASDFLQAPQIFFVAVWIPPVLAALVLLIGLAIATVPAWRAKVRWRLPAFRDASLAQLASAMALMLKSGTPFPEALSFAAAVESDSPAGPALAKWRALVESGQGKPAQWPQSLKPFPPMFLWLVRKGGEDLAAGFQKAAEIYHSRASYKIEMALYGALPISVLLLGQMVIWQVTPVFRMLILMMNSLGGNGE
jgi:type II secretory pathway component PulF